MISLYGASNPTLQRALIEICFSSSQSSHNLALLDFAIKSDALSGEQLRVLPLIFLRASISGLSDFSQSRIRGIYKHTLYRNHLILDRAARIQAALVSAGFESVLFLKGIPTVLRDPQSIGVRPMADLDILVPDLINHSKRALELFQTSGLTVKSGGIRSVTALDKDGFEYDLHWYLHDWALRSSTVQQLFAHSVNMTHREHVFAIPCIEHHLAHVMAHGVMEPTLTFDARWGIDALMILTGNRGLNADRIVSFANKFSVPDAVHLAIDLILRETPESVQIDRQLLHGVSSRIRRTHRLIGWLYKRQPIPNLPAYVRKPVSRIEWFKAIFCFYILPLSEVCRYNDVPPLKALGSMFNFPPSTPFNTLVTLLRKTIFRLPYAVIGLWATRKK